MTAFKSHEEANLLKKELGSKFKRFEIDLESGKVAHQDLMTMPNGAIDFPTFNKNLLNQPNQYYYLVKSLYTKAVDKHFKLPIVKYDVQN